MQAEHETQSRQCNIGAARRPLFFPRISLTDRYWLGGSTTSDFKQTQEVVSGKFHHSYSLTFAWIGG